MKLKHPDSAQKIEVRDEDAEPYLSQGWEEIADAKKKSAATADEK